jgi:hypothetical protein
LEVSGRKAKVLMVQREYGVLTSPSERRNAFGTHVTALELRREDALEDIIGDIHRCHLEAQRKMQLLVCWLHQGENAISHGFIEE